MIYERAGEHWSRLFALGLGAISAPIGIMGVPFGLMVAGEDPVRLALMASLIAHPIVSLLYYSKGGKRYFIAWVAIVAIFILTSIIDAITLLIS